MYFSEKLEKRQPLVKGKSTLFKLERQFRIEIIQLTFIRLGPIKCYYTWNTMVNCQWNSIFLIIIWGLKTKKKNLRWVNSVRKKRVPWYVIHPRPWKPNQISISKNIFIYLSISTMRESIIRDRMKFSFIFFSSYRFLIIFCKPHTFKVCTIYLFVVDKTCWPIMVYLI